MAIEYLHVTVGFAGMVNVMRAVPSFASIETPATIDCANTQSFSARPAIGFGVGYLLSRVFSNLATLSERSTREATLPFNR